MRAERDGDTRRGLLREGVEAKKETDFRVAAEEEVRI